MATPTEQIQQLYIAYFNRPADVGGLAFWLDSVTKGTTVASIATQFAAQAEYKATYGNMSPEATVAQVYENLFNRAPDANGLAFWANGLRNGTYTIDNIVTQVSNSALNNANGGPDTVAVQSKIAAAVQFTEYLKTDVNALIAYSTGSVNQVGKNYVHSVTDAATLATATTNLAATGAELITGGNPGQNFALTANIDALTGTAGNDTFTAGYDLANKVHTLSGLDNINGGTGIDTLSVTDSQGGNIDLSVATLTGIEKLVVRSVADIGANNKVDVSTITGLTDAAFNVKSTTDVEITAAKTTAVVINDVAGAGAATVIGGGNAITVVTNGDATIGDAASKVANAYTSVSVTGATKATITDNSGTSAAIGKTLTTVTLDDVAGASTIEGNGVSTLNLSNLATGVTVTNTTAHALTINSTKLAAGASVTDAKATGVTLNATGDTEVTLAAAAAKSLTVSGAGDVALTANAAGTAKLTTVTYTGSGEFTADLSASKELTSVNSSTATGTLNVTIAGTNAAAAGAAAQSVTGGAGDDTVTITGLLGKGSTLSLGAGSDVVAISGAGAISADAVVDAGADVDTLSLTIVDAVNVGAFKNFELFDVAGATGAFDQAILDTKNTVTGFVGTAALGGALELQNLGAGVGFTVKGDMDATVLTLTQATAGALTITSDVDSKDAEAAVATTDASFNTNATSVKLVFDNNNASAEDNTALLSVKAAAATTVTVVSGGTEVSNTATLDIVKATSIVVTGDQHVTLDIANLADQTKAVLASVDASAATGGVTVDTFDLTANGTIKLGSGDDIINLAKITTTTATASTVVTVSGAEVAANNEQAADATGFDIFHFAGATVAVDHKAADATSYSIEDGLYKLGSGVQTLANAITQIAGNVGANEAVVFTYNNVSYLYASGATSATTDDAIVKLTGVTGIDGLGSTVAGDLYLVG